MLRLFNPADLLGLVILQCRADPNLAIGRREILAGCRRSIPLSALISCWFPRRRSGRAWVYARRWIVDGVISIARRRGQNCWEVDHLQVPRGQTESVTDMLEGVGRLVGGLGGERVFIRVPLGDPLEDAAAAAGFNRLLAEECFVRPSNRVGSITSGSHSCRDAGPTDVINSFRLYCSLTPPKVREGEGVTLGAWSFSEVADGAATERVLLTEKAGEIYGLAAVSRLGEGRILDLLVRPDERATTAALIDVVLEGRDGLTTVCLVPEYMASVGSMLESRGFERRGEFLVYVKSAVGRVRQRNLVPVGA